VSALLERVVQGNDPGRLADALGWLLAQPQPLDGFAELVARAVGRLGELDPLRAVAAARRVLDVFGPRIRILRDVVLDVANRVNDGALAVALLEREVASQSPSAARGPTLVELARRRRALGEGDAAALTLVRALDAQVDPEVIAAEVD